MVLDKEAISAEAKRAMAFSLPKFYQQYSKRCHIDEISCKEVCHHVPYYVPRHQNSFVHPLSNPSPFQEVLWTRFVDLEEEGGSIASRTLVKIKRAVEKVLLSGGECVSLKWGLDWRAD